MTFLARAAGPVASTQDTGAALHGGAARTEGRRT